MTSTSNGLRCVTWGPLLGLILLAGACSSSSSNPDGAGARDGGDAGGDARADGLDAAAGDVAAADRADDAHLCPFPATSAPPAAIAAPAGTTLAVRLHADGTQVYTCTATASASDAGADAAGTTYAWTFKAPQATLTDETCTQVAVHSAGPTWTNGIDGDMSSVKGMAIASAPAPTAGAIPWLLLRATSHQGIGAMFSEVTYIQRLDTAGGVAPTTGCDAAALGTDKAVPYTASYFFYKGGPATDGGTPDSAADAPPADAAPADTAPDTTTTDSTPDTTSDTTTD
jgi:hypothetical protein